MIPRFLIRNIKCCEFLLIHKAKKAVSISEKECPAGNRVYALWLAVEIKPTIEGIKNGRDELMEKAIEIIKSK